MAHPFVPDPPAPRSPTITRRRLLQAPGVVAGAVWLGSCSGDDTPGPSGGGAPVGPGTRYDQLRSLRELVRSSPDHLGERARRAVESKDPATIAEFIRSDIGVLPPNGPGDDPLTFARWGHRGALRGGAGSLRERADLAVELLSAAGITAKVVRASLPAGLDAAMLYRGSTPSFAPDPDQLDARLASAGLGTSVDRASTASTDPASERLETLVDDVLGVLGADRTVARAAGSELPSVVPIVELGDGDATRWIIALGDVGLVDSAPAGLSGDAPETVIPSVSVAVSVAVNPPPGSPVDRSVLHELMSGSWSADQLVGRHLMLSFPPPGSPADSWGLDVSDVPTRVPSLSLQSLEALPDTTERGLVGATVTLSGAIHSASSDAPGEVVGPYGTIAQLDDAQRAGAISAAAVISATATAVSFPDVELAVTLSDGEGRPVDGLGAADFAVIDGETRVPVDVTSNRVPDGTRVLVVYDTSGSVTDSWQSAEARTAFETAIAAALTTAASASPFLVQVVGVDQAPVENGWRAPDTSTVASALGSISSDSGIWQTVGQIVPGSGAAVAILISDNASTLEIPERIPGWKRALAASGIPIVSVPVGQVDRAATDEITKLSGGSELDPHDPSLAAGLADIVGSRARQVGRVTYRIRYRAPEAGPPTRQVGVALAARSDVSTTTSYEVPAVADRAVGSGVAGVYVTVTVNGRADVRRLGGVEVSGRGVVADVSDAAAIAEATTVLNSITSIAFEPDRPTVGAMLDDAIGAALTLEPVEAAWSGEPKDIVAASTGMRRYPTLLAELLQAVASDRIRPGAATPEGLRVVTVVESVDGKELKRHVDAAPALNRYIGTSADRAAAFRDALAASIALSVREATAFGASAAGALSGAELVLIAAGESPASVPGWPPEVAARFAPVLSRYVDSHRLVPTSATEVALWVVDPETGSCVAVDESGRGGARSTCHVLDLEGLGPLLLAISGLTATCTFTNPATGSTRWQACVGFNTFGSGVAAVRSFRNPVSLAFTTFGFLSMFIELLGPPGPSVSSALLAVLLLMVSLVGGISCE